MIKAEQFIHALFNGVGYQTIKSQGVDKILSDKNLEYLKNLPRSAQVLFPADDLLAVSHVKQVHDEFGRPGIYNHTILITLNDYCQWTQPRKLLEAYFQKELTHPVERLEPLHIP